jgi:argininosuccinate lyase
MTQKKLWGGRFEGSTHSEVDQFNASINFDQALAEDDITGSLAHAAMLMACGILPVDEYNQIAQGLKIIAARIASGEIAWNIADEDVHMNIEHMLHQEIGDVAGKLHTARSRNDQVALDIHLYLRRAVVNIVSHLLALQEELIQLAQQHRLTLLSGYTHMQRAQPIYLAQHSSLCRHVYT